MVRVLMKARVMTSNGREIRIVATLNASSSLSVTPVRNMWCDHTM